MSSAAHQGSDFEQRRMVLRPVILSGVGVELEPLTASHYDDLQAALDCDPASWALQTRSAMGQHFKSYWTMLTTASDRISLIVRDRRTAGVLGTTSFLYIDPVFRKLDIGFTWLRPECRGTQVNPECKLLMLAHAFDSGAERVQFTVDSRNKRSRAAMHKLGATEEGILRRDKITWTGHKRDSVIFSIIADEWPDIRSRLERRVTGYGGSDEAAVVQ